MNKTNRKINEKIKVDYEREVKRKRQENIREVVKDINTKNMQEKIRNYAERHDMHKNFVEQKILDDPHFAMKFAKDPLKQSIHEKVAAKYIKSLHFIKNFKTLPSGGKNAKYVGPTGVSVGKNYGKAKSIDFKFEFNENIFFATHKYTGAEGGAQDNQYNDVKQFILEVVNMKQSDIVPDYYHFFAILDGPYYKKHERLKELNSLAVGCVHILNINEFEGYLIENIDKFDF